MAVEARKTHMRHLSVLYDLLFKTKYTAAHNIEKVKQFEPCPSPRHCRAWLGACNLY